jgi:hypothetical protein
MALGSNLHALQVCAPRQFELDFNGVSKTTVRTQNGHLCELLVLSPIAGRDVFLRRFLREPIPKSYSS